MLEFNHILQSDYSRNPDNEFPKQPVAEFISSWIGDLINLHGDMELITDWSSKRSLTAKEVLRNAAIISFELENRGFVPGDIVCCLIHSDVDYFSLLLGTWMSGCVVVALQHSFDQDLLLSVLRKSKSRIIFCDQHGAARCLAARKECPHIEEIIVFGEARGFYSYKSFLDAEGANKNLPLVQDEQTRRKYNPDETVAIVFSSGTTGEPKGILLTHENIYCFLFTARPIANRPGMKTLFVPRLGNVLGLLFGLRSLLLYSHLLIISDYSDENLFNAIEQTKPARILIYLPHILAIINQPKTSETDMSSVEAVFTAGMLINKKLQARLFSKMPHLKTFFTFYGLSEAAVGTMYPFVDYEDNEHDSKTLRKRHLHKPESVGRLAPMNYLKVIDESTGEILGPNRKGELCFKGPSVFKGYWNDLEATNKVKRNGWIHTGDIGYYDNDGDIFLVSRNKELIKYLGYHVIPSQLETILKSHPAVQDAAVIGKPHEMYGELPMAFVSKKDDELCLTAQELIIFVDRKVQDPYRLRGGLHFVKRIPRNVMGKILRNELQALLTITT